MNTVQKVTAGIVGVVSLVVAWLFDRIGILVYVILILAVMMFLDYLTGMLASKREALDHPDDPTCGWSSAKGAKGIIKKVGYLCVIVVAMVADYIILQAAAEMGWQINVKAIFGLMVAVWYLLNELLSIIENAGRMGAPVPEWLAKYISVLKNKIESKGENNDE
ncbi:MAG: phage holin family protein [Lachnospiraceae bacterium]|nr:phage holin family protein [Lachnospiraceae bacterium]